MAKVRRCIGESTVDFRQLAKFQEMYWRKYNGLSPIGEIPEDILAKILLAKFRNPLPSPINWNYVFSNADFSRNKTVYLTMIIIVVLYIILLIYARHQDRKDMNKVRENHFLSAI
jgi:hypothetical protein